MLPVAEGFGAASARRGESGDGIPVFQALLQIAAKNEFVEEASVETVARADGINRLNRQRMCMKLILAAFREDASRPAFDHNNGNET